ncbi:MAG: hypothetical protein CME60_12465 [Halobacteriovoraceae bacterium]|nr:hypothetical protein [Halobacteriovoraceae bacterium]|tara:strand:+ start:3125 stop:3646 length:522 start_codon:yes stop_codon:yes gene_type:complete
MAKIILFLFVLNFSHLTFAEVKQIKIRKTKLKVLKLEGWQEVEGFYGGDFTWIGPETSGPRPVIKLDVAQKENWSLEEEKKALPEYLINKKEWIKSKDGIFVKDELGLKSKNLSGPHLYNRIHYKIDSSSYIEEDWLIKCPKALVNISFLITPHRLKTLSSTWEEFIKSFQCQ